MSAALRNKALAERLLPLLREIAKGDSEPLLAQVAKEAVNVANGTITPTIGGIYSSYSPYGATYGGLYGGLYGGTPYPMGY